jgi:hypothetical protein
MKPRVKLSCEDGNVFSILGRCLQAARRAGWPKDQLKEFTNKAKQAQSYDEVLQIVMNEFEVE